MAASPIASHALPLMRSSRADSTAATAGSHSCERIRFLVGVASWRSASHADLRSSFDNLTSFGSVINATSSFRPGSPSEYHHPFETCGWRIVIWPRSHGYFRSC
jgi:hypothetical protein